MIKLKLGTIPDNKPIKLTIKLPAAIHRDLVAYGNVLGRETGQGAVEPAKLIAPMLAVHGDRPRLREIAPHGIDGPANTVRKIWLRIDGITAPGRA
jgi:hypothetical protein